MASAPKILILCDKNARTSFGRLALDLKRAMRENFETSILWLKTPKYFSSADACEDGDGEICARSLYTGFWSFRKPLVGEIRRKRADYVFFIRPEIGFLVPVVQKNCPAAKTVVLVHDTFAETLYPGNPKFKLIAEFYAKPAAKADGFVYNSDYSRREAERFYGIGDKPGVVAGLPLHPGYSKPEVPVSPVERERFLLRYGISGFRAMALNVSLPEPRKNIGTFFDMAARRPDVAFVRIGKVDGRIRKMLDEKKTRNVFHFSGIPSETLREFYHNANLYVAPSFYEGFGLPPLEAIACGTPVVCAKTSALAEIFDGICPLVSPATNVDGYLDVLRSSLAGTFAYDADKVESLLSRYGVKAISDKLKVFFDEL